MVHCLVLLVSNERGVLLGTRQWKNFWEIRKELKQNVAPGNFAFSKCLTAVTKVLYLEGRLVTTVWLYQILRFSPCFLIFVSFKNS